MWQQLSKLTMRSAHLEHTFCLRVGFNFRALNEEEEEEEDTHLHEP